MVRRHQPEMASASAGRTQKRESESGKGETQGKLTVGVRILAFQCAAPGIQRPMHAIASRCLAWAEANG